MDAYLRAIMHLEICCRIRSIDLEGNIRAGKVLGIEDIEYIIAQCRVPLDHLVKQLDERFAAPTPPKPSVVSLEAVRMKQRVADWQELTNYGTRVLYIRDYVNDMALRALQRLPENTSKYLRLNEERKITYDTFTNRQPPKRNTSKPVVSLTDEQIERLWDVLDPLARENPFKNKFVRYRNSLLLTVLIFTGLRRGEILGLRVEDIDWANNTITVIRRQDNKADKRRREPKAKTRERHVPVSADLLMAIHEYLSEPGLRKDHVKDGNPFVFISREGDPLTASGVQKIFQTVREEFPEFPRKLSAHICRHTANYILSKAFEAQGVTGEEADNQRRDFNGWSEKSTMPIRYNQRHIAEKTAISVLKAQEDFARRKNQRNQKN
ncbi:tyrosine-type recombinase/integrase [Noviherbaspirillum malthae]|uniref:tyrosine-type recombinase/integrase n=1 Tax=Noviherbaspirillum malthae TaxID=1260987 RepID=UPI00188F032D|nr:site-specific integrase [Noviherbaspirillum malthae]